MLTDLTGFQRDLLVVLSGMETPSGSELMQEIESTQDRSVLHGQLYSNLDDLVEEGYIKKGGLMSGRTTTRSPTEGMRSSRPATSGSGSPLKRGQTPMLNKYHHPSRPA